MGVPDSRPGFAQMSVGHPPFQKMPLFERTAGLGSCPKREVRDNHSFEVRRSQGHPLLRSPGHPKSGRPTFPEDAALRAHGGAWELSETGVSKCLCCGVRETHLSRRCRSSSARRGLGTVRNGGVQMSVLRSPGHPPFQKMPLFARTAGLGNCPKRGCPNVCGRTRTQCGNGTTNASFPPTARPQSRSRSEEAMNMSGGSAAR